MMKPWTYDKAADIGLAPGERVKSVRRESGLMATILHRLWWAFIRMYLRIWHRVRIEGRENLPRDVPFVMVANHTSHLDVLVLAAFLPSRLRDKVFPIAAGDVFFSRLSVGWFAALCLNALPIWRKKAGAHALADLRSRLVDDCCGYVLFPEGKRTRDGKLDDFKPGIGMLVAETTVPVIPCHLQGAFEAMPPHAKIPRPRKLVLRVGTAQDPSGTTNDRTGWKAIAQAAREQVVALSPTSGAVS